MVKKLTNIDDNFPEWYQDVITEAELVDTSPTRGSFVFRPYGYAIWENIRDLLNQKIKETGAQNVYLPLLIPESFLKKEAKHVEGFAPEVAVVTHAGGKKLDEPYVIRPTSETMVYYMFAKWIKSWRDLPLKINQWANIVRWELRTRAFLRTTEILWQEGHTAHETYEEARETALQMLNIYKSIAQNYLAIPVTTGEKTEAERFAGADSTFTFEAIMQDGKALQMGTSHILSQSFSQSFDVYFQDKQGQRKSPYCTSWGVSTRLVGALVMTHGDQNGLIIPPKIAPIQVVIVPIFRSDDQRTMVMQKINEIKQQLAQQNIRCHIDDDDQKTPGAKFYHWEVKGIPLRVELGPRDVEQHQAILVNRIGQEKEKIKQFVSLDNISSVIQDVLVVMQQQLFERAQHNKEKMWNHAESLQAFGTQMKVENGAYQIGWCGDNACEETLKEFSGTIRCILPEHVHKTCFSCKKESTSDILVAKAY